MNRQKLITALEAVRPGLSKKKDDPIEQSTSFAFIKSRVVTYNDEVSISYPVEGLEIEGAIEARKFYTLLCKIKQEDIELTNVKNEIIVKAGTTKAGFALDSKVTLPLVNDKLKKWSVLPEDFVESLAFIAPICDKTRNYQTLTCVHVRKSGVIEASDNYRVARWTLKSEMPVNTFLIPMSSTTTIVKMNPIKVSEDKGWIHFQTEDKVIISCRLFDDSYMDLAAFFKIEGTQIIFPKTVLDVLDRAVVFAKRDELIQEMVTILIKDNKFIVKSSAEQGSWFEEYANFRYKDTPIEFKIAPYLLRYILSKTLVATINDNKLKFAGSNWEYVTMLHA